MNSKKINIIFFLSILIIILIGLIFTSTNKVKETYESSNKQNNCLFNAYQYEMDTLFECKQKCIDTGCDIDICKQLCDNCTHINCKWTNINYNKTLIPNRTIIRGFPGSKLITWIKPSSSSEILKYYIIITKSNDSTFIEIHSYVNNDELLEYIIPNLEADINYNVYIVSKNKIGISNISNTIKIKPTNNNNNEIINVQDEEQKGINEKQNIINELETILIDNLKFKKPIDVYNINIY